MAVNAFVSNQGTQTNLLTDNTGGTGGTLIPVMKVSIDAAGTFGTLWGGNVGVSSGTINVSTISSIPNTPGGTINLATVSGNVGVSSGTINVSTISTLPNIPGGSIVVTNGTVIANGGSAIAYGPAAAAAAAVGNPLNIGGTDSGGTIRTIKVDSGGLQRIGLDSGTLSVLPNLPQGSINVTAGTFVMTSGTLNLGTVTGNLGTIGTIGLATVTGNLGTIGTIGLATVAGNVGISSGTINVSTISTLPNLPQGSINVTAGTFRQDARTTQNILSYGTQVSGTAAIAATIVGSASVGSGTSLWLQDVSVTNNNANVLCVLGFGTAQQGTNVLLRQTLGTSGAVGIEKSFAKAVNAGMTNQDLVFSLGAAGTVDLSISYLISA